MMDALQVVVPATPLPWWIDSKISQWRYAVDIEDIRNADPKNLGIFDWKILFEIALRSSASIWRLCPSLNIEQETVPILSTIQEVDFVTGRVGFRLHRQTMDLLLKHHLEFIRQHRLSPRTAAYILHIFKHRLDVLKITLDVSVLMCTDGEHARGDFPLYASQPDANKNIVKMLNLVLSPNGLRKTLLEAFLELPPSVRQNNIHEVSKTISPGLISPASKNLRPDYSPRTDDISPKTTIFPYDDLQSLIFGDRSNISIRKAILGVDSLEKRRNPEHGSHGASDFERYYLVNNTIRGIPGDPRRNSFHCVSSILKRASLKPQRQPRSSEGSNIPRKKKISRLRPAETTLKSKLTEHVDEILRGTPPETAEKDVVSHAAEGDTQSEDAPKPPTEKMKPRISLKHDELTIFRMDSSFAPVTRRQAAINKAVGNTDKQNEQFDRSDISGIANDDTDSDNEPMALTRARMLKNSAEKKTKQEKNTMKRKRSLKRGGITPTKETIEYKDKDKDHTDDEDMVLDSDTPDIELLTDSADEAEHKARKLRRRARKRLKKNVNEATKVGSDI